MVNTACPKLQAEEQSGKQEIVLEMFDKVSERQSVWFKMSSAE